MVADALVRVALAGTTFVFLEIGFAEVVPVADAGVKSEVLSQLEFSKLDRLARRSFTNTKLNQTANAIKETQIKISIKGMELVADDSV